MTIKARLLPGTDIPLFASQQRSAKAEERDKEEQRRYAAIPLREPLGLADFLPCKPPDGEGSCYRPKSQCQHIDLEGNAPCDECPDEE